MGVMGWSSTSMAARYQHVTDPIRQEVASRVGGAAMVPARDQMRLKLRLRSQARRLYLRGPGGGLGR